MSISVDFFHNCFDQIKFQKLLGEEGVEELLVRTVKVAVTLKPIASKELWFINVDSTSYKFKH